MCLWIARSVEIYSKKWQVTSYKNGLFNFFQAEKRQQMRQGGQRWTAFFGGESGFRGQQHHSLGITTGLVRRNNLLFIATLLHYRDLVLRHSVYDSVLFICQN